MVVTVFRSRLKPENQREWATNLQHVEAKKKGRADFYTEYKLQVCTVQRESGFADRPKVP